jgi:hypothetical protein
MPSTRGAVARKPPHNVPDEPGYDIEEQESPTVRRLRRITTPHQEAIFEALGGVLGAMEPLGLKSRAAVYYLLEQPVIRDREMAVKMDKATAKAGHRVPAVEIMKLAPWLGPDVHSPDPDVRRRALRARGECPRPESNWDKGDNLPASVLKAAA